MGELDAKNRREALGGTETKPAPLSTDFEDLRRAQHEGMKAKVYQKALGIEPSDGPARPQGINMSLDIGQLVQNQSANMMSAITAITEAQAKRPEDPFLKYMLDEMKDVRAKLDNSGSDPIQNLLAAQEVLDTLSEKMKQRAGVGQAAPVGGQDITALIELENAKADRDERARQWTEAMEERRHQWTVERDDLVRQRAVEDRRWQEEFGLKKQEFEESRLTRAQAADGLGDLVKTLAASIDERMAEAPNGAAARPPGLQKLSASPPPTSAAMSVNCECGQPMTIPAGAQHGSSVTCGSCGNTYQLSPKQAAEQKTPELVEE